MKLKYKRHKSSFFPFSIIWIEKMIIILTVGGYHHTVAKEKVIDDEDMLWESKLEIEQQTNFLYWLTNWDILLKSLNDEN